MRKSGFSTESRSRGHRSGVNLGKASAWAGGSRGPSEPTEKGGVGSGEAELSPEVDRTTTAKQRVCHLDIPTSVSC